jgi:hypothetical protein
VLAAGVVLALVFSRGDQGSGAQLRALREDPLGRYVPPSGRIVRTDAAAENAGGIFTKATPATFRRLIAIPAGAGPAAMQEAVDAASASGWTVDGTLEGVGATGHKQLSTGRATMSLSLLTDARAIPGSTPPPVLSIALEHIR